MFAAILKNLTQLHSERPKLYTILAFLSAVGLNALGTEKIEFSSMPNIYGKYGMQFCQKH